MDLRVYASYSLLVPPAGELCEWHVELINRAEPAATNWHNLFEIAIVLSVIICHFALKSNKTQSFEINQSINGH